jgi:hypothetical protein
VNHLAQRPRRLEGELVSIVAVGDLHKEAFEFAKRTIDVLIAEKSALFAMP